jgi:hypothetical protein
MSWRVAQRAQVRRARAATPASFFDVHNCRRAYLVNARIEGIRAATPLTEDEAVFGPAQMIVQMLMAQLRVFQEASNGYDAEIEAISSAPTDYGLFASCSPWSTSAKRPTSCGRSAS